MIPVSFITIQSPNFWKFSIDSKTTDRIQRIAKTVFQQMSSPCVGVAILASYSLIPLSVSLVTGVSALFAVFLIVKDCKVVEEKKSLLASVCTQTFTGISAHCYSAIWFHEMGHALAARACYQNPKTMVRIRSFSGGMTSYSSSGPMTFLGRFLGERRTLLAITAAGIGMTVLTASIALVCSQLLHEKKPVLADCLQGHAKAQLVQDIMYGFTSFSVSKADISHDFIRLWTIGGIHPLLPIIASVAIPSLALYAITIMYRN